MTRLAMKNRYVHEMNRIGGNRATSAAYGGFTTSMPISVPVNSHGRFSIPPAAPISSRIGRMT